MNVLDTNSKKKRIIIDLIILLIFLSLITSSAQSFSFIETGQHIGQINKDVSTIASGDFVSKYILYTKPEYRKDIN